MSQPWRHPKTGVWHYRARPPADLKKAVLGSRLTVEFDGLSRTVKVGEFVKINLGTTTRAQAIVRHSNVEAQLQSRWAAERTGTITLDKRRLSKTAVGRVVQCSGENLQRHDRAASGRRRSDEGGRHREDAPADLALVGAAQKERQHLGMAWPLRRCARWAAAPLAESSTSINAPRLGEAFEPAAPTFIPRFYLRASGAVDVCEAIRSFPPLTQPRAHVCPTTVKVRRVT